MSPFVGGVKGKVRGGFDNKFGQSRIPAKNEMRKTQLALGGLSHGLREPPALWESVSAKSSAEKQQQKIKGNFTN